MDATAARFCFAAILWGMAAIALPRPAAAADGLAACTRGELEGYLKLAEASERAYDDTRPGLARTPAGCVALVEEDGDGNLVVAFRGSLLGDRQPKHRFSNLGGANIRRNYRDWVATNLKQATGFLPRQYGEAAALAEEQILKHPTDKLVYLTGHSKGGGAATYAFVAAHLSPRLSPEQKKRLRAVTFNAAVVREQNWRRLFRGAAPEVVETTEASLPGTILALCLADDPVANLAAGEERRYVKRLRIAPATPLAPLEQHGIRTVIREIENRLAATD